MSDRGRDLYQWDGSQYGAQTGGCGTDRPVVPAPTDGGCRFRDEVYVQPQPREFRSGDNVMIVYGNVYIDQSRRGGCTTRYDGRQEYSGYNYNYGAYCDPRYSYQVRQSYSMPYYEYGVRVYGGSQGTTGCYDSGWNTGGYYSGGNYSRDTVYGGRGGYSADRTRYQGGYQGSWDYGYQGGSDYGYRTPPYVPGAPGGSYSRDSVSGGRGGYSADRERYNNGGYYGNGGDAGQVFDFALRGFDAYAGYDIARRQANNDRNRYQPQTRYR
jgi:hypothetical protein